MPHQDFKGLYTAIVTPFTKDGSLDEDAFGKLVTRQREAGVDGVVVCGTTGESPTVSSDEFETLLEIAIELSAGKMKVIAGTGTNSTEKSIQRSRLAKKKGADALLLAAPYYNKPTQNGLYEHYQLIARQVDLPQIIYNVPGRSGCNILPETVARLAIHPNIVAVKEASGDINQIMDVIAAVPDDFTVFAGDDAIGLPCMACGGSGVISVISNQAPAMMAEMVKLATTGDISGARRIHYKLLPLMKANFRESNPLPVKASLHMMGLIKNTLRLPMTPMDQKLEPELRKILEDLNLLS